MSKTFSQDEISKHDNSDSCWIIVKGRVYDVTNFLSDHPGGGEIIVESSGADATEAFENVGHSSEAREILEKYYIGSLEGAPQKAEPVAPKKEEPKKAAAPAEKKPTSGGSSLLIPLIVVGVAFGLAFFLRSRTGTA